MTSSSPHANEGNAGFLIAASAYVLWGMMPLYWRALGHVPALEVVAHRIVWAAVFVGILIIAQGHLGRLLRTVREPRTLGSMLLTSALICANWATFVYCVETGQLVEASLGFYLNPLVSFALGFIFFGERMSRLRLTAAVLATVAVLVKTMALGHISWIALTLAFSFSLYGYFHKRAAKLPALDCLMVETALLLPFTGGYLLWLGAHGQGIFPSGSLSYDALLIASGPVTAVPLALFGVGARKVRLTTLGFLQYLSPSMTLAIAVFVFGETFTTLDMAAFGCVWAALALIAIDGANWASVSAWAFSRKPTGARGAE